MICDAAGIFIDKAIAAEWTSAVKAHGLFHSDHEAWAVLREEVEELLELLRDEDKRYVAMDKLWDKVRRNEEIGKSDLAEIYEWAKSCAEEAVQVMAMIQKWGEGIEQREPEEG